MRKEEKKTVFIFVEFIQINFVSALLRSTDLCSHRTKHTVLHMASPPTMIKEEKGQRLWEKETDIDRKRKWVPKKKPTKKTPWKQSREEVLNKLSYELI